MPKFLVLGLLQRDLHTLGTLFDNPTDASGIAERAVREARMEQTFVIPIEAAFSATGLNWASPDVPRVGVPQASYTPPPLNPHSGAQAPTGVQVHSLEVVDPHFERFRSGEALGGAPTDISRGAFGAESEGGGSFHPAIESQGLSPTPNLTPAHTPAVNPGANIVSGGEKAEGKDLVGDKIEDTAELSTTEDQPNSPSGGSNDAETDTQSSFDLDNPAETPTPSDPMANASPSEPALEGNSPARPGPRGTSVLK